MTGEGRETESGRRRAGERANAKEMPAVAG